MWHVRRTWRVSSQVPVLVLAAFVVGGVVGVGLLETHQPLDESGIGNRPIQIPEDGYVSSQTCKTCHPQQYASWHQSFHRTMTQVPASNTVIPSFDNVDIETVRGRPMHLDRREDEFWATFDDPDSRGPGRASLRITRQVVLMTGSHQQQQYWYATEQRRLLGKLPAAYLVDEKRWVPRRSVLMHPPDEPNGSDTGAWNGICIACHTTSGRPRFDSSFGSRSPLRQLVDSRVAEFGIACEACHGPAAEHIRLNRNPWRRYWLHLTTGSDPSIAQPQRLSPQRSSQVCGQCHGIWEFYNVAGERQANLGGLPYRPGDELSDTRFVVQPTRNLESPTMKEILASDPGFLTDSFWSDGMVRVSGREYNGLIESPCFKDAREATRRLTCYNCHTMHKAPADPRSMPEWADTHQLSTGMDGNEACLQCHQKFRTNLGAHTQHRSESANSCYNCHMPYTTYGLLRALRSHQVNSPNVAASVSTGRPNACNLCHMDKTLAWTSEYLGKWYGTPAVPLSQDEQQISAALLWMLRGDAGQRALVAWGMGWSPAEEASGTNWMAPFLAQLLDDPYDAVRIIASRSLSRLAGFAQFRYDFLAPSDIRREAISQALSSWRREIQHGNDRARPELLLDEHGELEQNALNRLERAREDRRVSLRE